MSTAFVLDDLALEDAASTASESEEVVGPVGYIGYDDYDFCGKLLAFLDTMALIHVSGASLP